MDNIRVPIFVESRYRVNRKRIKSTVGKKLGEHSISGPVEVSIAIVGDRKMRKLSQKYKGEDKVCNILSFSQTEGEGTYLPKDLLRLGDLVISYPQVIKEASREDMLVDDKIDQLLEHGLNHLLGIHHEE